MIKKILKLIFRESIQDILLEIKNENKSKTELNKEEVEQHKRNIIELKRIESDVKKQIETVIYDVISNDSILRGKIFTALYYSIKSSMEKGLNFKQMSDLESKERVDEFLKQHKPKKVKKVKAI